MHQRLPSHHTKAASRPQRRVLPLSPRQHGQRVGIRLLPSVPLQGPSAASFSSPGTHDRITTQLIDVKSRTVPHPILRQAMCETIAKINSYTASVGAAEPSLMNFCVTDGVSIVATRYISSKTEEAASLFFSTGSTFEEFHEDGEDDAVDVGGRPRRRHFRMNKADRRENIMLIACVASSLLRANRSDIPSFGRSEPLTFERGAFPGSPRVPSGY